MDVLPDKDHELDKYDTIISNLKNKYELLLKKQSETDIAIAGRTKWDVTVLSHASAPYSKKTKDYVRLALGPLLSIIVGLGLAFFLETLDHSVKNMSEAEEYLELPVLATISEVSNQP
jgi:capsular polysaccharide biosynthesis protein